MQIVKVIDNLHRILNPYIVILCKQLISREILNNDYVQGVCSTDVANAPCPCSLSLLGALWRARCWG